MRYTEIATKQSEEKMVDPYDRVDFLRLARTKNLGAISFFHLMKKYGTPTEALKYLTHMEQKKSQCFFIPSRDVACREIDAHLDQNIHLVFSTDPIYPSLLKNIKDCPPVLSMKGRLSLLEKIPFAIVGSRNASYAGQKISSSIAKALSEEGWLVISGLARGIDTCVHKASLEGGTMAVIAGGIGNIYPSENKGLYEAIAEQGILLSEDALGSPLSGGLFPKRNRLISGLSRGVLVVEAGLRSGSLLTAKYAAEQGRDVFAVPGHPLDPRGRGVNALLKQGATLVESEDDIFQEYKNLRQIPSVVKQSVPDSLVSSGALSSDIFTEKKEEDVYSSLQAALTMVPTSVDDLSTALGVSSFQVRALLVEMELNGEIQHYPGDAVLRTSDFFVEE